MKKDLLDAIVEFPRVTQDRIQRKIREKALLRTRARLIESGVKIDDLSDEELEVIIADEEDKLIGEYKTKGLLALLALLGLSWI